MKILETAYTIPQSKVLGTSLGISRYAYYIGYYLKRFGHDVELFIRDDYKPDEAWIKAVRAPKQNWIVYPFFLANAIRKEYADVYFSDYPATALPFVWTKKRPFIATIHDAIPLTDDTKKMEIKDRIINKWYRHCFNKIKSADAMIVRSHAEKENALRFLPDEKVKVVFGGVDLDIYKPIKKKRHGKIRIGYLGGLDGRKNAQLLVTAFAQVAKERNDLELHIAGTGKSLMLFKGMKIPNTRFYGFMPEERVVQFLNSLDIFIYPSLREGFGLAPLEAMACGLPVIACNVSSMPEVVGNAGVLVEPNIESMKNGIEKLADNRRLRNFYSMRGLSRAKKLTWENVAKQALKVLENVRK